MAKDDYDVLVYKILLYLYAVFKRKKVFDEEEFKEALKVKEISEEYLINILNSMQEENLIKGLSFINPWGGEVLLSNDYSCMKIKADGIHYLSENGKMKKVRDFLLENADIFASLIKILCLEK